jgi:hypothetical protein
MSTFRKLIVVALLAVWSFPAVGSTKPLIDPAAPAPPAVSTPVQGAVPSRGEEPSSSEAERLQAREQAAPELQDFRGGGVSIYIGSGAALVLFIILLIILI